jgi:AcrR family transcriptional regulator
MSPGAVYVHFASKQALLLAVYEEGVERILRAVEAAVTSVADPWLALEAAVATHLRTILDGSDYAKVMTQVLPRDVDGIAAELRALRARYEGRFGEIVSDLRLPRAIDERLFRLMLLGAMNWSPVWYRAECGDV